MEKIKKLFLFVLNNKNNQRNILKHNFPYFSEICEYIDEKYYYDNRKLIFDLLSNCNNQYLNIIFTNIITKYPELEYDIINKFPELLKYIIMDNYKGIESISDKYITDELCFLSLKYSDKNYNIFHDQNIVFPRIKDKSNDNIINYISSVLNLNSYQINYCFFKYITPDNFDNYEDYIIKILNYTTNNCIINFIESSYLTKSLFLRILSSKVPLSNNLLFFLFECKYSNEYIDLLNEFIINNNTNNYYYIYIFVEKYYHLLWPQVKNKLIYKNSFIRNLNKFNISLFNEEECIGILKYLKHLKNIDYDIRKILIILFKRIKNMDRDLKFVLLDNGLGLFKYMADRDYEFCIYALNKDIRNIKYIKDQIEEYCWISLKGFSKAMKYIKNQTYDMVKYSINCYEDSFRYFKEYDYEIVKMALMININNINYLPDNYIIYWDDIYIYPSQYLNSINNISDIIFYKVISNLDLDIIWNDDNFCKERFIEIFNDTSLDDPNEYLSYIIIQCMILFDKASDKGNENALKYANKIYDVFLSSNELLKIVLKYEKNFYNYIKEKTEELNWIMLDINIYNIRHINNPTIDMYLKIIDENIFNLDYLCNSNIEDNIKDQILDKYIGC